jgi:hypothetical protein
VSASQPLALRVEQAAEALNVPLDVFEEHVRPSVRIVRCGTIELVPVAELDKYLGAPGPGDRDALHPDEAAARISTSRDLFDQHVRLELRLIYRGRKVLVPIRELERWLDEASAVTGAHGRGGRR